MQILSFSCLLKSGARQKKNSQVKGELNTWLFTLHFRSHLASLNQSIGPHPSLLLSYISENLCLTRGQQKSLEMKLTMEEGKSADFLMWQQIGTQKTFHGQDLCFTAFLLEAWMELATWEIPVCLSVWSSLYPPGLINERYKEDGRVKTDGNIACDIIK